MCKNSDSKNFTIKKGKMGFFNFNNEDKDCIPALDDSIKFGLKNPNDYKDRSLFLGYRPNNDNTDRITFSIIPDNMFIYQSISAPDYDQIIVSIGQSGIDPNPHE